MSIWSPDRDEALNVNPIPGTLWSRLTVTRSPARDETLNGYPISATIWSHLTVTWSPARGDVNPIPGPRWGAKCQSNPRSLIITFNGNLIPGPRRCQSDPRPAVMSIRSPDRDIALNANPIPITLWLGLTRATPTSYRCRSDIGSVAQVAQTLHGGTVKHSRQSNVSQSPISFILWFQISLVTRRNWALCRQTPQEQLSWAHVCLLGTRLLVSFANLISKS